MYADDVLRDALKSKNRYITIYGLPHPIVSKLILEFSVELVRENMKVVIIDSDYLIDPSTLLPYSTEVLTNILLYKPKKLSDVMELIDLISFSTKGLLKTYSVIINSLYVYVSRHLWDAFRYDPLYIVYSLKRHVKANYPSKATILIYTAERDFKKIPLSNVLYELSDLIYQMEVVQNSLVFTKIKGD
ncbi:MAG: hypothetical protein QXH96_00715 [Candidatus Geothermarchaeota archaeon]